MLITLCQSIHNSRVWIINQHYAPRGDYLLKVSSRGGKIQRIIVRRRIIARKKNTSYMKLTNRSIQNLIQLYDLYKIDFSETIDYIFRYF